MAKITYKATICFDTGSEHPDAKDAKGLQFTDTYSFNSDVFGNDTESMVDYMKRDLSLVAGGGYDNKHINNVTFKIDRV